MATHTDFGTQAEQLAKAYLEQKGYCILKTNYRVGKAEVDIIAIHNNILVVVEVKARSTAYFGNPESFITPAKIKRLVGAIQHYMDINNLDLEVRFDAISVLKNKQGIDIKHIEDAFYCF